MIDFKFLTEILEKNLYGVMATMDYYMPKTRVFQYLFTFEGRIYFGTTSDKPVYTQIMNNPSVSFCTFDQDFSLVLSINGRAIFDESPALKAKAMEAYPAIKSLYKSPDNPIFKIFYIDIREIQSFSFESGSQRIKV